MEESVNTQAAATGKDTMDPSVSHVEPTASVATSTAISITQLDSPRHQEEEKKEEAEEQHVEPIVKEYERATASEIEALASEVSPL